MIIALSKFPVVPEIMRTTVRATGAYQVARHVLIPTFRVACRFYYPQQASGDAACARFYR